MSVWYKKTASTAVQLLVLGALPNGYTSEQILLCDTKNVRVDMLYFEYEKLVATTDRHTQTTYLSG